MLMRVRVCVVKTRLTKRFDYNHFHFFVKTDLTLLYIEPHRGKNQQNIWESIDSIVAIVMECSSQLICNPFYFYAEAAFFENLFADYLNATYKHRSHYKI